MDVRGESAKCKKKEHIPITSSPISEQRPEIPPYISKYPITCLVLHAAKCATICGGVLSTADTVAERNNLILCLQLHVFCGCFFAQQIYISDFNTRSR